MVDGAADLVDHYRAYLARFESIAGDADFGAFIKHNGRLIKKLRYEEFEPIFSEYSEMSRAFTDSMARGDTINDVVTRILRDHSRSQRVLFDLRCTK